MKYKKLALALAMTFGFATQASAAPVFMVDPSSVPGGTTGGSTFTADFISGTSSELLTLDAMTNTLSGAGWAQFTSFSLNASPVSVLTTRLGFDYGAYLTFSVAGTLASGTLGALGSTYNLTQLDYVIYVDPNVNTTFQAANTGPVTPATVTGGNADDVVLGFGGLVTGVSGLTTLGGAFLNSINSLALCNGAGSATADGVSFPSALCTGSDGTDFFIDPVPFFNLAFTEFNNTSQGLKRSGNFIAITSASGGLDFNRVPEPSTVALMSLGLFGLGALSKRKASK